MPAFAEEPSSEITNPAKAKQLFQEKKRKEALAVLSDEKQISKEHIDLSLKISERFFTDEAQQEFETGESQRLAKSDDAETSYKKSAELEPDNLQPKQSLLIFYVERGRCSEAQQELGKILQIFPQHPRGKYFQYLISRCLQNPVIPPEKTDSLEPIFIDVAALYQMLESKSYIQMGKLAKERIDAGAKHPDLHYYLYLSQEEMGQSYRDTLKKFVQMCKSSGEKEKRTYKWDPYYCSNLSKAVSANQALEDI